MHEAKKNKAAPVFSKRPLVLGHRGMPAKLPENSLSGFIAALVSGADGIELDIQKSADGRFIIIHDNDLERTAQGRGSVCSLSSAQIHSTRLKGSSEAPPLLEELVQMLGERPGIWINVELKEESIEPEDADAIQRILSPLLGSHNLIISSFRHDLLIPFSRAGWKTGLLLGDQHQASGFRGIRSSVRAVKPYSVHLPVQMFSRLLPAARYGLFSYFRILGLKLIFWTVNSRADFLKLPPYTAGIIGDNASELLDWLGRGNAPLSPGNADASGGGKSKAVECREPNP